MDPVKVGKFEVETIRGMRTGLFGAIARNTETGELTIIPPSFDDNVRPWRALDLAYREILEKIGEGD